MRMQRLHVCFKQKKMQTQTNGYQYFLHFFPEMRLPTDLQHYALSTPPPHYELISFHHQQNVHAKSLRETCILSPELKNKAGEMQYKLSPGSNDTSNGTSDNKLKTSSFNNFLNMEKKMETSGNLGCLDRMMPTVWNKLVVYYIDQLLRIEYHFTKTWRKELKPKEYIYQFLEARCF